MSEEKNNLDLWLYAPLSKKEFDLVRRGKVQTNDAFLLNKTGLTYSILFDRKTGEVVEEKSLLPNEIELDCLHDDGYYLECTDSIENLKIDAIDSKKHQLEVKIESPIVHNRAHTIPLVALGNVCKNFQKLINDTISYIARVENLTVANVKSFVALHAWIDPIPGSFGLQLESEKVEKELASNIYIEKSLNYIFDLINELEANDDNLVTKLSDNELTPSLMLFGEHLRAIDSELALEWASPSRTYRSADIRSVKLSQLGLEVLSKLPFVDRRFVREEKLSGKLDTFSCKNKQFILEIDDEKFYKGKVSDQLIDMELSLVIGKVYNATIEEWEFYKKGKKKKEYLMTSIIVKVNE
ncbi:hypothetical protein MJH12_03790 [bacterium]|nr:hypothetical protein [bacterium]